MSPDTLAKSGKTQNGNHWNVTLIDEGCGKWSLAVTVRYDKEVSIAETFTYLGETQARADFLRLTNALEKAGSEPCSKACEHCFTACKNR